MGRFFVLVVLALVGILSMVSLAACGGSDIPDDVEWEIVGQMEPAMFGGGNYGVRLNEPVSEDVLRAIGKEVKHQHIEKYAAMETPTGRYRSGHATVRTFFYLPGMDISGFAWASARFDPNEVTIKILGNR